MNSQTLFLIDGSALAYRSYFAFISANLQNSEGIPTGPIYGFANTLITLMEKEDPTHIAVVWDTAEPTFRHEMDENYKANRPPQPEELQITIPLIKQMIEYFGIENIEKDGYEADDIIGTLATQARDEQVNVYLVTPDKDFMQLVGGNIRMYKPQRMGNGFEVLDEKGVEEYFGVPPEKVIDVLALIGDSSDNIPGVPGIGKKGAPKIIQEYGSLEQAIAGAPQMKSKKAREGLTENADQARLSRRMITIETDVPETLDWRELAWQGHRTAELQEFFKRMEFETLGRRLPGGGQSPATGDGDGEDQKAGADAGVQSDHNAVGEAGTGSGQGAEGNRSSAATSREGGQSSLFDAPQAGGQASGQFVGQGDSKQGGDPGDPGDPGGPGGAASGQSGTAESPWQTLNLQSVDYRLCTDTGELSRYIAELRSAGCFCFDTETTGVNPLRADMVGLALSAESHTGIYIPFNGELPAETILEEIAPLFENPRTLKIAHNYKYDYVMLRRQGLRVAGPVFDTMLAAYVLDSGQKFGMDVLSRSHLGYDPVPISSLIGEGKQQKNMREIPAEQIMPYACEDADITLRLYEVFDQRLRDHGLDRVAGDIEFPLTRVLAEMELAGVKIDTEKLGEFSGELARDMQQLQSRIYEITGEEFNINSPQQLGQVLFKKMKLPASQKTATGQYSTSEAVLSALAHDYEIAGLILEFRALAKLKSTYVDNLPKMVDPKTGRVHSSFNQNVTATGRLSSSNPNLQNIPVRTERGREIRKAFIAEPGWKLLAADYSQVELRIIASMSGDEAMIRAFRDGEDIHARTAKEIFDLASMEQVTREERRKAKEVNFGIPYGVSAYGLSQRLGIARKEGQAIIDAYFDRFPKIREYINQTLAFAREYGYVATKAGRRRYIPDINSKNASVRGFAERTAINMPIQGTAADVIKLAMIRIDLRLREHGLSTRMLLQVHDELVFEVPEAETEQAPELIRQEMEHAMELDVPFDVDLGLANNWLQAH